MGPTERTVRNTATGETIRFIESSAEPRRVRVVAEIRLRREARSLLTLIVSPRFSSVSTVASSRIWVGTDTELKPGQRMIVEPHKMHGYRKDTTAQPATIKVAAAPPTGGLDPILRTLSSG
jgi:hypothetical protein